MNQMSNITRCVQIAVLVVASYGMTGLAYAGGQDGCQKAYNEETKQANEDFKKETHECKGKSGCIGDATKKKADRLKAAGKTLTDCRKEKKEVPGT